MSKNIENNLNNQIIDSKLNKLTENIENNTIKIPEFITNLDENNTIKIKNILDEYLV